VFALDLCALLLHLCLREWFTFISPSAKYASPAPRSFSHSFGKYWCFIRLPFFNYQIGTVYLWMWIALLVGLSTYITLFFYLLKHGARSYWRRVMRVMLIFFFLSKVSSSFGDPPSGKTYFSN
jgi:hypothetical protein